MSRRTVDFEYDIGELVKVAAIDVLARVFTACGFWIGYDFYLAGGYQ